MAGPPAGRDPAIPLRRALCVAERDARLKAGHDDALGYAPLTPVIPAKAGIQLFLADGKDVDGRDKPGHDEFVKRRHTLSFTSPLGGEVGSRSDPGEG